MKRYEVVKMPNHGDHTVKGARICDHKPIDGRAVLAENLSWGDAEVLAKRLNDQEAQITQLSCCRK